MNFVQFGAQQILRPSKEVATAFHSRARAALLRHFKPGVYVGRDEVNPVLKKHFEFYENRLRIIAPKLACRGAAELLLTQYDKATEILHGNGIHDPVQKRSWARVEPGFKRAIKYLTELFCIEENVGEAKSVRWNARGTPQLLEEALLCAEMLADLAETSHRTHLIFPKDFELTLHQPSSDYVFETKVRGPHAGFESRFGERVAFDRKNRDRFMGVSPQLDVHPDGQAPFLDGAFEAEFGMSYSLFIGGLMRIIDDARPVPNGFPTLFIKRSDLVKMLCGMGAAKEAIEVMLRGFTVTPRMLREEGRVIWNAKQESRAYRRGFFGFAHSDGGHLAYSRSMAREAMIQLVVGACYQKLPNEWKKGQVAAGLSRLSNASGKWFERIVGENLQKLGFRGGQVKDCLGNGKNAVKVPQDVGNLDFIGYHSERNVVLLVEAKMTNTGVEAQYWRDDIDQYVKRQGSYAERFRRKVNWFLGNSGEIARALKAKTDCSFDFKMVTLYPCIASEFIDDFQCLSLAEFMAQFESA